MGKIFRALVTVLAFLWATGIYSTTVRALPPPPGPPPATPAPTGFDNLPNGFAAATFDADKDEFEDRDSIEEGLGPVYNAQACAECHQSPVTGGISQITELRAGPSHPGGSLINDRAVDASIQEHVLDSDTVRTLRTTLNTLGDGFVEAIADSMFTQIRNAQPSKMRGQIVMVPVKEAFDAMRVGRFGWKDQHASLLSFSGDAYLNEQGITNKLFPVENTSNGNFVNFLPFDILPDGPAGEDPDDNIEKFAEFMRATKAPPRGDITPTADMAGQNLFNAIGCGVCHTPTIVTAPAGSATVINFDGTGTVPATLGNKIIHPFGDFLLHDIGTSDHINQNGVPDKMRTPPLWGVRTRSRLMHDGRSLTFAQAIKRHKGQAEQVADNFEDLSQANQKKLLAFLGSL